MPNIQGKVETQAVVKMPFKKFWLVNPLLILLISQKMEPFQFYANSA